MSQESPRLLRAAPYLLFADLGAAAAQYERTFGFSREYTGGDPPEFVVVSRDSLPIMLRRASCGAHIVPNEQQGGTWDVFFWVSGLHALHEEMVARGAAIVYGPIVQPYGVEEFAVRDLEGYVLGFGESSTK